MFKAFQSPRLSLCLHKQGHRIVWHPVRIFCIYTLTTRCTLIAEDLGTVEVCLIWSHRRIDQVCLLALKRNIPGPGSWNHFRYSSPRTLDWRLPYIIFFQVRLRSDNFICALIQQKFSTWPCNTAQVYASSPAIKDYIDSEFRGVEASQDVQMLLSNV